MYEQEEFDRDFDGLRVQLDDLTELRVNEIEYRGERRVNIRIWRIQKNKLTNKLGMLPTRQGLFLEISRLKDKVLPYINKIVED